MEKAPDRAEPDRSGTRCVFASPAVELRTAVLAGAPVRRGAGEPATQGHDWSQERSLPADVLYELLARPESGRQPRAAVLVGLRITGRVNFEAAELRAPLVAHACYFDEPINLMGAKAAEIRLTACHLDGLAADGLETRGDLDLSKSSIGVIGLVGARIGGQLSLDGTALKRGDHPLHLGTGTLRPPESPVDCTHEVALMADVLHVNQDMFCQNGFSAAGHVRLLGAHIGGLLSFDSATLDAELDASGAQVGQDMLCQNGFSATGEVRLSGAHIGGLLSFDSATLDAELDASGAQVGQDMLCRNGFSATGEVRLSGAHIGGQLSFDGATLTGGDDLPTLESRSPDPTESSDRPIEKVALLADGLRVDGDMVCENGFSTAGQVRLLGAHIGGQLRFGGAVLTNGLNADGLQVNQDMFCNDGFSAGGDVWLRDAHLHQLLLDGATLATGLRAEGLQVDRSMSCQNGFSAGGAVRLFGAQIGSQLSLNGAKLAAELDAGSIRVHQDVVCQSGFSARGEVGLIDAHIGQLWLDGAKLETGLRADGLHVDRGMFCRDGFSAGGDVRLLGAHIGGQLWFDGAVLAADLEGESLRVDRDMAGRTPFTVEGQVRLFRAHIAGVLSLEGATLRRGLAASGLRVDQDMPCGGGLLAEGDVDLAAAHITGQLSFDGATLKGTDVSLGLQAARVDELSLTFARRPTAQVDLRDARVGTLWDSERTWPSSLDIQGCIYGSVEADEDRDDRSNLGGKNSEQTPLARMWQGPPSDVQRRLRWIQHAENGEHEDGLPSPGDRAASLAGAGYMPQPYTQLMAVYRQQGRDSDARHVAYARERRRRRSGLAGRAWSIFLRWTVGYGYKPLRAVAMLGILALVGTLAFSSLHGAGDLPPVRDEHAPFVASIYTIDRLIPVVSFGLRDSFGPRGAAQWWAFAYTLLGWALTIAVIAGLNAAVRRD
jgi:hypothetical protein